MLPELITGGVERGTLEIGAYLVEKGHRSIVVSNGGPMVDDLVKNGTEHITMPVGSKNPRSLLCIPKLRKLFVDENVDIVHLRSRMPAWIGYLAIKSLAKNKQPKIVSTFHGFYSINRYSAIMTKGERVIAVSNTIKNHIKKKYFIADDKIKLIYRGYDSKLFDPKAISSDRILAIKKKWDIEYSDAPVIILPGRFTKLKGHSLFLSALEKIKHLSWVAVIVGNENENPEYASHLKNQVQQKGLSDRIIFAGHCSDMAAAYMVSDLTVSASIYPESFGRIAVESQAMGVPVIASALGGSLETVLNGKTGWHFSHLKVEELVDTLTQALCDERQRKLLGQQGMEWVRKKFSGEIMCKKTLDQYTRSMSLN